ncbi:MAG: ComEC/Rec2 family competence protein, partial [Patescibacteria group bacterium]
AALLAGLTFGSRSDFSKEFKEKMSQSGTTHLVALSGYNISVLVLTAALFFRYFLRRRAAFYVTVLVIILFVLMVGGEASVVRAALMGFLALLAKEAGRIYSFRNAITLAAAGMVLFDPTILRFNIGFQLSFLALLGIVYLEPALRELFRRLRSQKKDEARRESFLNWRENALTTLSAQLAVAPLIIENFSEISLTSLLANILILVLVPFTMALGFLIGAVGFVAPYLAVIVGWLANVLLAYEIGVINIFSYLRIPVTGAGSWILFALYYAALLGVIIYTRHADEKVR